MGAVRTGQVLGAFCSEAAGRLHVAYEKGAKDDTKACGLSYKPIKGENPFKHHSGYRKNVNHSSFRNKDAHQTGNEREFS